MSWNTWWLSMTNMKNVSDAKLQEMRSRLQHMMSVYRDSISAGGILERMGLKEMEKCEAQMERIESEIRRRNMQNQNIASADASESWESLLEKFRSLEFASDPATEEMGKKALDAAENTGGLEHDNAVAWCLMELATFYLDEGEYAKAEPLYQRAISIREKAARVEPILYAASLQNLADLYLKREQYAKAEPLLRKALGIRETAVGPGHITVGMILDDLALVCAKTGRRKEADLLSQRAMAIEDI